MFEACEGNLQKQVSGREFHLHLPPVGFNFFIIITGRGPERGVGMGVLKVITIIECSYGIVHLPG